MGLISSVVAYKVGKRRGERRASKRNTGASDGSYDPRCDNYHYCKARGVCDNNCTYEDLDDE